VGVRAAADLSFVAVLLIVVRAEAKPVFLDSDITTSDNSPHRIGEYLAAQTPGGDHLSTICLGHPAAYSPILTLANIMGFPGH